MEQGRITPGMPPKGASSSEISAYVEAILNEATLEEKVAMMSGKGFFEAWQRQDGLWGGEPYQAGGGIERLGIAPLYFTDGPRGVARGQSTCFPCSMARGASFDPDLEYRIGQVMGIEARAQDCTLSGAVCFNLLRHPGWGRAQETYGEDQWHLGVMGAALGTGIQDHNVVATVKHYALNSMENMRFIVNVKVEERALHEVYLPHFKYALDHGVASVMSAYNKYDGEYCGQNRHLLTDILRGEWGFDGFVHSDWVRGVYRPYGAAAGLDVENPEPIVFGKHLVAAVQQGAVEPQVIDTACRRILTTQFRFACAEDPLPAYESSMVACEEHVALAREAAEKSAVLLENDGILPLDRSAIGKLAVLGKLAALENTGDNGSSRVNAPYVVTPLTGLTGYLGEAAILTGDEDDLDAAGKAASQADAVVVVVGYTAVEEGEFIPGKEELEREKALSEIPEVLKDHLALRGEAIGGDRSDLGLPESQVALIRAAAESGKPVIVVIVAGSAVLVEGWSEQANAILQSFYAGMEGGTALARLLFGEISPSGKLPFTVAKSPADYPFFDRDAVEIEYGYWHGYAKFDHEEIEPRYPFGHGMGYSPFSYRAIKARRIGDRIDASIAVRNDGKMSADEVVQLYIAPPGKDAERPRKMLRGFERITLAPGETKVVHISVALETLRWRDPATHGWKLESGSHGVLMGGSSDNLLGVEVTI